jgi:hypothetical protein
VVEPGARFVRLVIDGPHCAYIQAVGEQAKNGVRMNRERNGLDGAALSFEEAEPGQTLSGRPQSLGRAVYSNPARLTGKRESHRNQARRNP